MNHPHLKSPILISSKPPLVSPELQDSKEGTFTISSRTRGTQIKEPTRSARRQREPAESRQTDIHLSVPAPGEAAGLRRSVHAPETRRRPAGACGEARRAEAAAAASIPMAPLLLLQRRRRRRDYSCSLFSTGLRRRGRAQRDVPEASGSMGLHGSLQPYLDEAEARGGRRGNQRRGGTGAPSCPLST